MSELARIEIPGGHGEMWVEEMPNGKIVVHRLATRGNIRNVVEHYDLIGKDGRSTLCQLTKPIALRVLQQVTDGVSYSSAFIVADDAPPIVDLDMAKTSAEHTFTSTGQKFWRHSEQMFAYKNGSGNTVVSTHISPEGACNLKCPYCSVTYRDTHSRIALDVVRKYISDLHSRGLKAIIFTGGGEPSIWPHLNEVVQWAKWDLGISIALITNGTQAKRLEEKTWKAFSWVRVSLNVFDGWEEKIAIPREQLADDCVVGCSMVVTSEHQSTKEKINGRLDMLRKAAKIADKIGAVYGRLTPNCLLEQKNLLLQHRSLDFDLEELGDKRFFHQHKQHETPKAHVCHQAHFRPYLSEEKFKGNGQPGTLFPCDSTVLTDSYQHFAEEYQICHASDVLDFLDGRIKMKFDPSERCGGCVFTSNVNMLDDWKKEGVEHFNEFAQPVAHEEFV